MVFDRLFRKKEEDVSPVRTLGAEDVSPWARDERASVSAALLKETSGRIATIEELFATVSEEVAALDEKELEEDLLKRLETITVTSKRSYCSTMRSLLEKREARIPATPDELRSYAKSITETLVQIQKISVSKGRYLGIAFEADMRAVSHTLKDIALQTDAIEAAVRSRAGRLEALGRIEDLCTTVCQEEDAAGGTAALEAGIHLAAAARDRAQDELARYEASEEYRRRKQERVALDTLRASEHEENLALYEYVAPVRRILKKYLNAAERGTIAVPPQEVAFLAKFQEYPVISLRDDEGLVGSRAAFGRLYDALDEGRVDEKKARSDKARQRIRDLLDESFGSRMQTYRDLCRDLSQREAALGRQEDPTHAALRRAVDVAREALARREGERDDAIGRREAAQREREHAIAEMKRLISEFYPKITVNF
ncbi:MAG: hypothetical protein KO463_06870 [Candidatus Methanofastidiosa archaeon]|nr:hypothetical protein [Candidatus Methanofastidiosa archaeon]